MKIKVTKKQLNKEKKKIDKGLLNVWKKKGTLKWGSSCEICDSMEYVQGHHFFPQKNYPQLKYDVDNYVPLCRSHHFQLERLKRFDIMYQIIIHRGLKWLKKLRTKL